MRKQLSALTELAWSQGKLASPLDRISFGFEIYEALQKRHGPKAGIMRLGFEEIFKDLSRTLKVLQYGNRQPVPPPDSRLDELLKTRAQFFAK